GSARRDAVARQRAVASARRGALADVVAERRASIAAHGPAGVANAVAVLRAAVAGAAEEAVAPAGAHACLARVAALRALAAERRDRRDRDQQRARTGERGASRASGQGHAQLVYRRARRGSCFLRSRFAPAARSSTLSE